MSQRISGYQRQAQELYETPPPPVQALCEIFPVRGLRVWDGSCGPGKLARALQDLGAYVLSTDIDPHPGCPGWRGQYDFLEDGNCPYFNEVAKMVMNPPYGHQGHLAEKFIARGLRYLEEGRIASMALLLSAEFDSGSSRARFFRDCPSYAAQVTLLERIVWFEPPPDKPNMGPSTNHAWYVWRSPRLFPPISRPMQLYAPLKKVAA